MCKPEIHKPVLTRQEKIDLLNDRVVKITEKEIRQAKEAGKPLAPEFVYAQQKMTTLTAGSPVYQLRSGIMVYIYAVGATLFILKGASMLHPLTTFLCFMASLHSFRLNKSLSPLFTLNSSFSHMHI